MAFNANFGATTQAVFQDPGLYQQIAQKSYLPEAIKSLWNMNATLQDAVQKNRIANEIEAAENDDKNELESSLADDMKKLEELKAQLEALQNGGV